MVIYVHPFRALVATTWLFSMLLWLFVVARIVVDGVNVYWPFIDRFPLISISEVGVAAFILSFVCMFTYLTLWGNPLYNQET